MTVRSMAEMPKRLRKLVPSRKMQAVKTLEVMTRMPTPKIPGLRDLEAVGQSPITIE